MAIKPIDVGSLQDILESRDSVVERPHRVVVGKGPYRTTQYTRWLEHDVKCLFMTEPSDWWPEQKPKLCNAMTYLHVQGRPRCEIHAIDDLVGLLDGHSTQPDLGTDNGEIRRRNEISGGTESGSTSADSVFSQFGGLYGYAK